MALWGISTTTETAANNYAIPKFKHEVDRNRTPWNTFADVRGWIYRRYKTTEQSGLSTNYYDEVLVPVAGLNTAGGYDVGTGLTATGLNNPTVVAVFFEDPNKASPITIGAGGTTGIGTGKTGYVHVVWNENVFCSAGATVKILQSTGAAIVGYANSTGATLPVYMNDTQLTYFAFNGQTTNRVAFAFTAPSSGIGTVLSIDISSGVAGVVTSLAGGTPIKTFIADNIHNVGGAGTYLSVHRDTGLPVGIGTTTLTITA
jgi:hypothetical protein